MYLYLCVVCIKNGALRHLSLVMRKPACCIYENKDEDQLRSNCADEQRLCLRCTDSKSLYYQHLLLLHSPVYVGLGQKPRRPVFSQRGSFKVLIQSEAYM